MKTFEKLEKIDPKWVYLIMAIALVFPVLRPVGLAVSIDKETTMKVYDWVESLSPGDVVIGDVAFSGGAEGELGPQLQAWFRHCMQKGVKVVMVAQWNTGARLGYTLMEAAAAKCKADGVSAEYGTDWVYVGYKPGGTNTWRAMQADFWETCGKVDMLGNTFDKLPLMSKVRKWDKQSTKGIMIFAAGSPGVPTYTTYFPDYDIYVGAVAVEVPGQMNLLRSAQIKGLVPGLPGAAQYEMLLKVPGKAVKLMDAQSMGHLWIMLLVILGNIAYVSRVRGSAKKAG